MEDKQLDYNLRYAILQEAAKAHGPRLTGVTTQKAAIEIVEIAEKFYNFVVKVK